jgi:putative intracellular protease/amidase
VGKRVVMLASNYGLWAEELQAPWDALRKAGHEVTLATPQGKTPLPLVLSMDADFVDPVQQVAVNTPEVVARCKEILEKGEWDHPIKIDDADMADYDVIVAVGGPGSPLDVAGNPKVHQMLVEAYKSGKVIGCLCYAVGALVWARDPDNGDKSIIYGKTVVAHPREWDFTGPLPYPLYGATKDNPGTDLVTSGFNYPLRVIVDDAVGPNGKVLSDPTSSRAKPQVHYDHPFVTGLSVESCVAFGDKLVQVLAGLDSLAGVAPDGVDVTTPGWKFYEKHLQYFYKKDVEGLVANDYNEDAVCMSTDFVVQGRQNLKGLFHGYLDMIGDFKVLTTERYREDGGRIVLEATMTTQKAGIRKVYDIFEMENGKISRHFTGVR